MRRRIAVFGPTAVGKSAFCLALAKEIGGEIVNADAVQLYRGFDIGSAKPSCAERERVAHHLVDVADPGMDVTVATYQMLAEAAIGEIERRGRVPIVSGGSGLYVRAALGEWDTFGRPPDPMVRQWVESASLDEVYARALALAPGAAARLSPQDRPRLVRLIERGSERHQTARLPSWEYIKIGLYLPREELYARIDARALTLWPHLVTETRRLLPWGPAAVAMAERTIGYREALRHLRGELGPDEALREVQTRTRRFAKRQLTWWRREPNTIWLRPEEGVRLLQGIV